jgi:hypothetical protein
MEPLASLLRCELGHYLSNQQLKDTRMTKIAGKLAELRLRAMDLEAQIALQSRQAAFLGDHGRTHEVADKAIAGMEKRLTSLKRSCAILARHVAQAS